MANGYVQNMNPLFRQPFHQRFPGPQQQQRPPPPASNDPSAIFASSSTQDTAQCMFPSAFPPEGPNIIQRFWIRLFMTLVHAPYTFLRSHLADLYYTILTTWDYTRSLDVQLLTLAFAENRWSILIGLFVVVLASLGAYFFSPKGENNTIWRWVLILSFSSCYIMWAITFLAQWHPLIQPRMTGLRPGYAAGS